ncbi:putative Mevalonate kinase [Blattamonas nauphoetae]|uniref:Mevalonate kinase n=1 Tax=Blattamonas nauphoetae TaxID=2049346 RepID=A0ABQ9XHZ2_9EUKA|nr:putative Mevalonate kinase [Blattamonas nauphoetae]
MLTRTCSSPGKVILFGEHSVVHEKSAVVTSIDLRTTVTIRSLTHHDRGDSDKMKIELRDFSTSVSFEKQELFLFLRTLLRSHKSKMMQLFFDRPDAGILDTLMESIRTFVSSNLHKDEVSAHYNATNSISCILLFLLLAVYRFDDCPGTGLDFCLPDEIVISSRIPIGCGLGTSGAFCCSVSGCILSFYDLWSSDEHKSETQTKEDDNSKLSQTQKIEINKWAFIGECVFHARPSGVDNFVSCFGNIVKYRQAPTGLTAEFGGKIFEGSDIKLLVVNTGKPRQTREMVEKVRSFVETENEAALPILSEMDEISNRAWDLLQGTFGSDTKGKLDALVVQNQSCLEKLGVSSPEIRSVLSILEEFRHCGKLTGGGGGGCVICFMEGDPAPELSATLHEHGFTWFIAPFTPFGTILES